jgi:hypothetical protein
MMTVVPAAVAVLTPTMTTAIPFLLASWTQYAS